MVSWFVCRCEHRRSDLICLPLERTIISMVAESIWRLVAASRVTANLGNPEARRRSVRHAEYCRNRYNRVQWRADAAIEQILVDQVVPSVRVGNVGLTCATNGGTTHADNRVFSCDICLTADRFGAWHTVGDDGRGRLGRPGG